ncbi:MAG: SpoIID/LytB domain-containing protein [Clostridiaceae bacterium]
MFRKLRFKLLSAAICALMLSSNVIVAQAATLTIQDKYNKQISVGLTSLNNISTLDFTVTENYYVQEKPDIIIYKGAQYNVTLSDSLFKLYKNGTLVATLDKLTIYPNVKSSYIKFVKDIWMRFFSGSITFVKQSSATFVPVNKLNIEDYVKGVIPYEVSESYPEAALKVQAVAARTYALANLGRFSSYGYDLTDNTSCQVYRGYNTSWIKCNKAVDDTKGEVLTYNGSLITSYFCSSDGGYTEDSGNVWSASLPYLKAKPDSYDTNEWTAVFTADEVAQALKAGNYIAATDVFTGINMDTIETFESGRISNLELNYTDEDGAEQAPIVLTKEKARTFFKSTAWPYGLKSALYTLTFDEEESNYTFTGKGYGHGVGMSQTGCLNRANAGQDYEEILTFYYDGTEILKLDTAQTTDPSDTDNSGTDNSGTVSPGTEDNTDTDSRGDMPIVQKGWVSLNGNMYYYDSNGSMVKNKWMLNTQKSWTYLGSDGAMVKNKWVQDSSLKWFYLGSDGVMVTSKIFQDSTSAWYCVGSDGARIKNQWMLNNGKMCYFGANGIMVTNKMFQDSDSKWYYVAADGSKITNRWMCNSEKWYYFGSTGEMLANKWKQDSSLRWFYLGSDGAMLTNEKAQDSTKQWFYLGSDGALVTNRWILDSGNWYFYGSDGAMNTNKWKQDSSKHWFYLGSDGIMKAKTWVLYQNIWYYLGSDGAMLVNNTVDGYKINSWGGSNKPVN